MSDIDAASFPIWCAILLVVTAIAWVHRERTDP